jgi:hypothetical protein
LSSPDLTGSSSRTSRRFPARPQTLLIILSVAVLLFSEAASFRRWELKKRVTLLLRLAGLSFDSAELQGSIYDFDPEYARFLERVRELVPPRSSVAVSVPATTAQYVYTAHYVLAPRIVFEGRDALKAEFLAVYDPVTPSHSGVHRNDRDQKEGPFR